MVTKIFENGINGLISNSTQYISERGIISLLTPCYATNDFFEIYCLKGNLFFDIERFDTLEESEKRIQELLYT